MGINLKKLFSNFFSLSSVNIIGMIIPIVTMPILSRALGPDIFGTVLLYNTVLQFGFICVDYSFNFTGTRKIAENPKGKAKIYVEVQLCRLLLVGLYVFLVPLFFAVVSGFDFIQLFLFTLVGLLGHWFLSIWYFQGLSKLKQVAMFTIVARLIYLLMLLVFVNEQSDFNMVLFSNVIPFLLAGLLVFFSNNCYKNYSAKVIVSSIYNIPKNFKSGIDVFIGDFAPNFYNNIPMMIVGINSNSAIFAAYAVATRITNACVSIQGMIAKAIFPLLVTKKDNGLKFALICNLILSIPMCIIVFCSAELIVNILLGSGYESSSEFIRVAIFGVISIAIANSFGQGYFLPKGLDRIFRNVSLFVSIVSAIVGAFLLYYYDVWGAVYLLLFARTLFSVVYYFTYISYVKKSNRLGETLE